MPTPNPATTDWVPLGPSAITSIADEMAYAENPNSVSIVSTVQGTPDTIITAPAITVDGATKIVVEYYCPLAASPNVVGKSMFADLWMDSGQIGRIGQIIASTAAVAASPFLLQREITPPTGTHTFSVRGWVDGGANATFYSGTGGLGTINPMFIRIRRVSPYTPPGANPVTYGTTLPASPVDGQETILVDSTTNPSYYWRLRYNAGSTGPKWEFIGGIPGAGNQITAQESITSGTFADLTTVGPSFTLPRAGDYLISWGAQIQASTAGTIGRMGLSFGGAAPAGSDVVYVFNNNTSQTEVGVSRSWRYLALAAGVVKAQYSGSAAGAAYFSNRWLNVTPIRIS